MRGKARIASRSAVSVRITPAYAGKSVSKCNVFCITQDHPRLCGEKPPHAVALLPVVGSPPPMRGKVYPRINTGIPIGITPAYAGKSGCTITVAISGKDHPRLCGEKFTFFRLYSGEKGSPPPMRGKAVVLDVKDTSERITPAYAGKS